MTISPLLPNLEPPRHTRLEQPARIILPAHLPQPPLHIHAITPQHVLRDIGVVQVLEVEVQPLLPQQALMLVDDGGKALPHHGVVGWVGVRGCDDGHDGAGVAGLEAEGVCAVADGLRLDEELGEHARDGGEGLDVGFPLLDQFGEGVVGRGVFEGVDELGGSVGDEVSGLWLKN